MPKRNPYIKAQKLSGIESHDIVRIMRGIREDDMVGWTGYWSMSMDKYIGHVRRVTCVNGKLGIRLNHAYYFPFYVLSIVSKRYKYE